MNRTVRLGAIAESGRLPEKYENGSYSLCITHTTVMICAQEAYFSKHDAYKDISQVSEIHYTPSGRNECRPLKGKEII